MVDRGVDRTERHRDEGLYIPRVENEKKEREKFSPLPPEEDEQILLATFFGYLKKIFDAFSPSKKIAGQVIDLQAIIENLKHLKRLLEQLSQKDVSKSAEFATELSDVWCSLLENFDNTEVIERKNLQEVASFREMLDTIKSYPPNSEHRFGYYLLQHAGKDWLPFPFIEILETLHKGYKGDGENSTLAKWCQLVDSVIANLQAKFPFQPGG